MSLLEKQRNRYSDIPINFTVHPVRGDLIPLRNEEAAKRALKNVIFTGEYERRFQPEWGAGIPQYLFENISDPNIEILLKNKIKERVRYREPRVTVLEVLVLARPDNNSVDIRIIFSMNNDPKPIILDVILERVR